MFMAVAKLLLREQQEVEKFRLALFIDVTQPGAPGVISRA